MIACRPRRLLLLPLLLAALPAFSVPPAPRGKDASLTPAEIANFEATPSYDETLAYLHRLARRWPAMKVLSYGRSPQGRALPLVVVSGDGAFTPAAARRAGKPVVMIQNGIHSGEIDGNDASLLLLRDMAGGAHREILKGATLLILPIYNVDGHERVSPYNRPNQNGPVRGMGFRTTTAGYDLNRDYLKLASVEARALIGLVNAWRPHLFVDDHVTDGVDHDWVLTWSVPEAPQMPPPVDAWLKAHLPQTLAATERAGHRCGPYVDLVDRNDPAKGFSSWVGLPRYSSGYFPLRNRPAVLVETHSYKPYRQRVEANRDFLVALLAEAAKDGRALVRAVAEAEAATVAAGRPDAPPSAAVLGYRQSDTPDSIRFPVYAAETRPSLVSGRPLTLFRRGEVAEITVPWFHGSAPLGSVPRPRGYLVLPGWPQIEERLRGQGLRVLRVAQSVEIEVETLRAAEPKYEDAPYQGATRLTAKVERKRETRPIPAGALWVPADQPDFELAIQLLEPDAPDSLLSWGYLSSIFEGKEYIDPRVLEGIAVEKLKDPQVKAEWEKALADEAFAKDPGARYAWWYRRTPYWDATQGLLPCYRVMAAPKLALEAWGR